MELFLIQHGEARSKEEDPERPLTEKGIADIKKTAAFFKSLGKQIDVIWHSGKKRAEQTAEILAGILGTGVTLTKGEGLAPNDDITIIKEKIENAGMAAMVIVGHLPHLSRLAADLLTDDEDEEIILFKNAGIVCLCEEEQEWELAWIVTPEILVG